MTVYQAKTPDAKGFVAYTEEENGTWDILYKRQMELINGRACDAYMDGLERLQMAFHSCLILIVCYAKKPVGKWRQFQP